MVVLLKKIWWKCEMTLRVLICWRCLSNISTCIKCCTHFHVLTKIMLSLIYKEYYKIIQLKKSLFLSNGFRSQYCCILKHITCSHYTTIHFQSYRGCTELCFSAQYNYKLLLSWCSFCSWCSLSVFSVLLLLLCCYRRVSVFYWELGWSGESANCKRESSLSV